MTSSAIKFQKHYVTNGTEKARVFYSLDNRHDGRACVTVYAKDFGRALRQILAAGAYKNSTDMRSDCFDQGCVVIFADSPLYAAARQRAQAAA